VTDLIFFGLFFAAIAIGWMLGRRARTGEASASYFSGQRQARRRAPDTAIDSLVGELSADGGNTQTRIALGVQLRRRGEVDGAVRIHQDLLTRAGLPADELAQAQLELARDYISAGLLDRAEELLLELVRDFPKQSQAGRRHLLDIYETERDWRRAIEAAKPLLPRKLARKNAAGEASLGRGQRIVQRLAHYGCELAEEERLGGDLETARSLLREALSRDKCSVRASILLAQVEWDAGRHQHAVQSLRRVRVQDPDYLPETIDLLRKCYEAMNDRESLRAYLLECLAARPTPALVVAVAEDMALAEGDVAAGEFLAAQLVEYPSLRGLSQLIGLQSSASDDTSRPDMELLQNLSQRLVATRPSYRCGHCGFAGKYLHWHCPGCKHWGSIKAIDGPGSL
jgi:lipopolysaccharide biosynthesis regulator YciM